MEEWTYMLNEPLPGRKQTPSQTTLEDEGQGFLDFMAVHNANVGGA